MTVQETPSNLQAIRCVYDNGQPSTASDIIHIVCHPDPASGKDVLLWDDIKATFDDVIHVQSGTVLQSFLRGADFKILDPLRIAFVPGVTLDIVVRGRLVRAEASSQQELSIMSPSHELSVESPQQTLLRVNDEGISTSAQTLDSNTVTKTPKTSRDPRDPAYGLENIAMEAYRNNDNPAFAPLPRGPHATLDDQSPPTASNNNNIPPNSHKSGFEAQPLRSLQASASGATEAFAKTMANARLGDSKSLVALGDMYRDGRGVRQDYKAAMNQYKKAADMRYADAQCNIGQLYYSGQGVPCNYSEAFRWYTLAANQGFARGTHLLGGLYSWGRGTYSGTQEFGRAAAYFLEAANQGYAPAQCSLGWL